MSKYVPKDKVKELLITKTAIKTLTSESIVEKIISFQGKDASKAVKQFNEVEFSGFGKFVVSNNKLKKRIIGMEKSIQKMGKVVESTQEEPKKEPMKNKIASYEDAVRILKTKLNEPETNIRGLEEQFNSTSGDQGTSGESLSGEIGDL